MMKKRKLKSRIILAITGVFTFTTLAVLFFILGYIVYHGISSINFDFLVKLPKPVGESGGGIANSIIGSLKLVGLAAAIGIPIGVFGAVYVAEFGNNRMGSFIRYCADVINGVPSIVVGIFAYTLVVVPLKHFSGLSGSVALAVILIPLVLRNTEEFIKLVPISIREGALALGVPRWKMILRVVLPTASRGIMTGSILAISRIAGETAPLIFTAFGNRFWDDGFLHPMASLPHTIFTYAISPFEDWHNQAWAAATILLLVVLVGNVTARILMKSPRRTS